MSRHSMSSVFLIWIFLTGLIFASVSCDRGGGGGGGSGVAPLGGTVRGTLIMPSRTLLDSDNGDMNNQRVPNDTPAEAQQLDNLVTVAGFVTLSGDTVDEWDYYSVTLTSGEEVIMKFGSTIADLDLFLVQGATVDSSTGALQTESVTAPSEGDYLVAIQAKTGGSIYNLSLGFSSAWRASSWSPSDEFIPGEAVLKLKTGPCIKA